MHITVYMSMQSNQFNSTSIYACNVRLGCQATDWSGLVLYTNTDAT